MNELTCERRGVMKFARLGRRNEAYAFVQWTTVSAATMPRGVWISHLALALAPALVASLVECFVTFVAGQCVQSLPPFAIESVKIHWTSLAGLLDAAGHSYALIALGTRVLVFASSPSCTWTSETSPPAVLYVNNALAV